MIPQSRRERLVCMIGAQIIPNETFDHLWEATPYGEVIEKIALAMASQYSPPDPDKD